MQLCAQYIGPSTPLHTLCKCVQTFLPELFFFVALPEAPVVHRTQISGGSRSPKGPDMRMALFSLFGDHPNIWGTASAWCKNSGCPAPYSSVATRRPALDLFGMLKIIPTQPTNVVGNGDWPFLVTVSVIGLPGFWRHTDQETQQFLEGGSSFPNEHVLLL
jgi:hypothetical protein